MLVPTAVQSEQGRYLLGALAVRILVVQTGTRSRRHREQAFAGFWPEPCFLSGMAQLRPRFCDAGDVASVAALRDRCPVWSHNFWRSWSAVGRYMPSLTRLAQTKQENAQLDAVRLPSPLRSRKGLLAQNQSSVVRRVR
ncbi:hypothetical protein ACQKWADRAFT_324551 [Trichoderma austrokoningii]